jgi:hypothetical protein
MCQNRRKRPLTKISTKKTAQNKSYIIRSNDHNAAAQTGNSHWRESIGHGTVAKLRGKNNVISLT